MRDWTFDGVRFYEGDPGGLRPVGAVEVTVRGAFRSAQATGPDEILRDAARRVRELGAAAVVNFRYGQRSVGVMRSLIDLDDVVWYGEGWAAVPFASDATNDEVIDITPDVLAGSDSDDNITPDVLAGSDSDDNLATATDQPAGDPTPLGGLMVLAIAGLLIVSIITSGEPASVAVAFIVLAAPIVALAVLSYDSVTDTARRFGHGLLDIARFRWCRALPDWAQPLVWGLMAALPIAGIVAWLASRR